MQYVVKLFHVVTRKGKETTIESILTKLANRNSFSPSHGIKERSGYRFDSPEEATAALDSLFDESSRRIGYEIIPIT